MHRSIPLALIILAAGALFTWSWAASAPMSTTVLYDGATGALPGDESQEFVYITDPLFNSSATQSAAGGATTLDTTAVTAEKAGYFAWRSNNPTVPELDRAQGFRLDFTVEIISENHAGSDRNGDGVGDRAGFSVILLADDNLGIEIAFWEDEIWAQEGGAERPPDGSLFTHAEGAAYNTGSGLVPYQLTINGNSYTLAANGVTILSGPLRDYTPEGTFPYTQPNFIFLGDNTSAADARVRLSYVTITTNAGAPPATATPTATPVPGHLVNLPLIIKE